MRIKTENTGLPKDHTGVRFTRLIAVKRLKANKGIRKFTAYSCLCDCGKTLEVRASALVTGNTKSCGCLEVESRRKKKAVDYTGRRFTRLTAITRRQMPKRGVIYECLCDCGNKVIVPTGRLQSGNTKSCGCLNKEKILERNHDPALILKRMSSASDATKVSHWQTQEELVCRGSWESRVVKYLNSNKIPFKWQVPFKLKDSRTYIIDLLLTDTNTYVEIKGWWRDDALEKFQLFKAEHPLLSVEVWGTDKLKELGLKARGI